jgi:outer membrane protein OmpA-like peptidoglycan-associated protein
MRGQIPFTEVERLSLERANAVKNSLVEKFAFDPNKFVIEGSGWNIPFDTTQPDNHALNRRVEISVYPPEAQ